MSEASDQLLEPTEEPQGTNREGQIGGGGVMGRVSKADGRLLLVRGSMLII